MSDIPHDSLDLREQIARIDRALVDIDRAQAETRKFVAEQAKLVDEAAKLRAEDRKLMAEAGKLNRDRLLAPALAITGLVGGIITIVGFVLQHWGAR